MLTKIQYKILMQLDEEVCYGFSWFDDIADHKTLSKECKILREMGLIEYHRGLLDDDGMVAGSGYCLSYGRENSEKRNELIKEYEQKGGNSSEG